MAEVTFTPKALLAFLQAAGLYSSRAWSDAYLRAEEDRQRRSRPTTVASQSTSQPRGGRSLSPSDRVSALGVPDHRVQQHGTLSVYSTQKKQRHYQPPSTSTDGKSGSLARGSSPMDRLRQASHSASNLLMQAGSDVASQLKDVFGQTKQHLGVGGQMDEERAVGLQTLKALASDPILLSKLECLFWPDKAAGLGFWDPENERAYTTWELAVLIQENANSAVVKKRKADQWGWTYLLKALEKRCKEFPFPPAKLRAFELMADVTPTPFLMDPAKVGNGQQFYQQFAASEADYCQSLQALCDHVVSPLMERKDVFLPSMDTTALTRMRTILQHHRQHVPILSEPDLFPLWCTNLKRTLPLYKLFLLNYAASVATLFRLLGKQNGLKALAKTSPEEEEHPSLLYGMKMVKSRIADYRDAFEFGLANQFCKKEHQTSFVDLIATLTQFEEHIADALYLEGLSRNLEALAMRSIDYSDATQMAKFGLLLSDGLVERTVQQHGTQAEGVFAFLFEKALITMAMIDHQGRVMLRYRQMLPLDKVELLKSSVTKQALATLDANQRQFTLVRQEHSEVRYNYIAPSHGDFLLWMLLLSHQIARVHQKDTVLNLAASPRRIISALLQKGILTTDDAVKAAPVAAEHPAGEPRAGESKVSEQKGSETRASRGRESVRQSRVTDSEQPSKITTTSLEKDQSEADDKVSPLPPLSGLRGGGARHSSRVSTTENALAAIQFSMQTQYDETLEVGDPKRPRPEAAQDDTPDSLKQKKAGSEHLMGSAQSFEWLAQVFQDLDQDIALPLIQNLGRTLRIWTPEEQWLDVVSLAGETANRLISRMWDYDSTRWALFETTETWLQHTERKEELRRYPDDAALDSLDAATFVLMEKEEYRNYQAPTEWTEEHTASLHHLLTQGST